MAKKHKKKTYNTPKKNKHIHKKTPLNIIKSIQNPLCKICDNRMAVHCNRLTCSYCNLSFV